MAVKTIFVPVARKTTEMQTWAMQTDGTMEAWRAAAADALEAAQTELNDHLEAGWKEIHSSPIDTREGIAIAFVLYRPDRLPTGDVLRYVQDRTEMRLGASTTVGKLYYDYQQWCKEKDYRPAMASSFMNVLWGINLFFDAGDGEQLMSNLYLKSEDYGDDHA